MIELHTSPYLILNLVKLYTLTMKITFEQLKDYTDFVKKTDNRDLDAALAYDEFYKLLTLTAYWYLPRDILQLLEINRISGYTESAIYTNSAFTSQAENNEYKQG